MRIRQIQKLEMCLAVCRCGQRPGFAAASREFPAFRHTWEAYLAVVQSILQQSARAQLSSEGATESKESVREALASAAAKISAGLVTWAEVHGQVELARNASVTRSALLRTRAIEASLRAEALLALARKHAHDLGDYGVTPARLDAFALLTKKFSEESGRPRSIIVERRLALAALPKLFAQASELLTRLDRLTSLLGDEHADFLQAYRASRRIVRVPASRERGGEKAGAELAMVG